MIALICHHHRSIGRCKYLLRPVESNETEGSIRESRRRTDLIKLPKLLVCHILAVHLSTN
jgi:hypothetical protein